MFDHIMNLVKFVVIFSAHSNTRELVHHPCKGCRGGPTCSKYYEKPSTAWLTDITIKASSVWTPRTIYKGWPNSVLTTIEGGSISVSRQCILGRMLRKEQSVRHISYKGSYNDA
jgi:hypothetical protein